MSNLDPALRLDTRGQLAGLHRRLNTTMVYVTHDQEEAMTLGTRIGVMRDGGLEQVDKPGVVYGRPANTFVAELKKDLNGGKAPDETTAATGSQCTLGRGM